MKTITLTQVTNALKYSITALVAVIALTGCGSRSNNNAVNGWNNGWNNIGQCFQNCVNGGSVNVMATARNEMSGVFLQIQFIGQQGAQSGTSGSYYGPVQAQGTLSLQSNLYAQCGLPMGQYSIQTIQPGQWQGTSIFQNLVLQSNMGGQIYMSGYIKTSATSGGTYGMSTNLYVNGCEMALY